jgi:hypothetical protein
MHLKSLAAAAGIAGAMVVGAASIGTPVQAQNAREAELIGFHQLCEKGDRRACIRFGMLGENRERHAEWGKHHADWWWWEGR